jgi:hypothetical protein
VDHIKVHANIDVGGYTWASQGFDFESQWDADSVLDRLREKVAEYDERIDELRELADEAEEAGNADQGARYRREIESLEDQVNAAQDILNEADRSAFGADGFPNAYEISQVGRGAGMTSWIGKDAMLGSDWQGVKPL